VISPSSTTLRLETKNLPRNADENLRFSTDYRLGNLRMLPSAHRVAVHDYSLPLTNRVFACTQETDLDNAATEASSTPTGRLKAGFVKIAGVARDEVKLELLEFMLEEDLPSLSQAVGAALEQWLTNRRTRRSSPPARDGTGTYEDRERVLHPRSSVQNLSSPTEGER